MMTIVEHMDELASRTWRLLLEGDRRRIRLREDTLTEVNLLDLSINHPELAVYRFNQYEESSTGGDWEWYIGSRRRGWFRLRIQAKRVDGMAYKQLDHGGERDDEFQYDTLIRSSRESSSIVTFPYYVFFNGWAAGWPSGADWRICPNGKPPGRCAHATVEHFGCAASPAELVRVLHGRLGRKRKRVEPHLSVSMPWSWLLRRPLARRRVDGGASAPSAPPPTTLAALAWHQAVRQTVRRLGGLWESGIDEWDAAEFWGYLYGTALRAPDENELSFELPPYVEFLLESPREPDRLASLGEQFNVDPKVSDVIVTNLAGSDD
jgi:hypothetical protein